MSVTEHLRGWAVDFIRHMDAFEKSIVELKELQDEVRVTHKKKVQLLLILPELDTDKIKKSYQKDIFVSVFTLNTKANLDRLIKSWDALAALPRMKVFFVNPLSQDEKKWVVCPHVHARVSDEDALKTGLQSMSQAVQPVTSEDIKKMG